MNRPVPAPVPAPLPDSGAVAVAVTVAVAVAVAVAVSVVVAVDVAEAQEPDASVIEQRVRVVRPREGSLRRGTFAVPGWVPIAAGSAVALGAGALLWRRARKSRR